MGSRRKCYFALLLAFNACSRPRAPVLNTYIVWQGSNLFSDKNFRFVKRFAAHATKQEKLYVGVDCRYLFAGAATTICCPAELRDTGAAKFRDLAAQRSNESCGIGLGGGGWG